MGTLPGRPDLDQLRRRAKELHRAAAGGDAASVRRILAVSDKANLSAAELAVAREHGFASWASMRAAVVARHTATPGTLVPDKHTKASVYGAVDLLTWAQRSGWDAGAQPVGAVFTAQSFITSHLERLPERYRISESLTPTNGRVFITTGDRPVAVACLGLGAPALVTLLEHLVGLGVRSFVAVGPAPAVSADLARGSCVVIDRAIRDDGVSHHYLEPARDVSADGSLTERLRRVAEAQGLAPRVGPTWTVPTPYRTTAEELSACSAEGVLVTELTTAALFAVALALGARAASAVIVTRGPTDRRAGAPPGPVTRTGALFTLLDAAITTLESDGAS